MKWFVNAPDGMATRLTGRKGTNLTIVNQGPSAIVATGGATEAGNTVTLNLSAPISGLIVGSIVKVVPSIAADSGYAGAFRILTIDATSKVLTLTNPTAGLAASTAAITVILGCDVYFDTSAQGSRLNAAPGGAVPDGTLIAAGGGQVQFTNAPEIWLRAQLQVSVEIQP